jgi:hypothetical protein
MRCRSALFTLTPKLSRRIDFADSLRFGRLHEQIYAGFRTVLVNPAPVAERAAAVWKELVSLCGPEILIRAILAAELLEQIEDKHFDGWIHRSYSILD